MSINEHIDRLLGLNRLRETNQQFLFGGAYPEHIPGRSLPHDQSRALPVDPNRSLSQEQSLSRVPIHPGDPEPPQGELIPTPPSPIRSTPPKSKSGISGTAKRITGEPPIVPMHVLKGSTPSQPAQAGPGLEEKDASKTLDFVVTGKGNLYSGKKPMVWIPDTGARGVISLEGQGSIRTLRKEIPG